MSWFDLWHRYTPPTCTLEVAARSPWLQRIPAPIPQDGSFRLRFDDPRTPDQHLAIAGNAAQLAALHKAVSSYVRGMLHQSSVMMNAALATTATDTRRSAPPVAAPPPAPSVPLAESAFGDRHRFLDAKSPVVSALGIHLKPKGSLFHELYLGVLATPATGECIRLGTLQLFDLATALEEYAAHAFGGQTDADESDRPSSAVAFPYWARIAAVMTATLVGTGILWYGVYDGSSPQQEVARDTELPLPEGSADRPFGTPESFADRLPPPPVPGDVPNSPPPLSSPAPITKPAPSGSTEAPVGSQPVEGIPVPGAPVTQIPIEGGGSGTIAIAPDTGATQGTQGFELQTIEPPPNLPEYVPPPEPPAAARGNVQDEGVLAPEDSAGIEAEAERQVFDTIPQVAEVRRYFSDRWNPPPQLTSAIEYRLFIGDDGSIQQIVPLGEAASIYLDRTGMPLRGDAFVSPPDPGQTPIIRLVLNPDGTVRTFLESIGAGTEQVR